ncbi:hypothetical protein EYF80_010246 [Liparis tanakae]|uniref:Uncharacterized protein n=1 Tax=Liparis tanakae TaxID=230148 RepID=A0A4Z2IQE1_9TELE|nr:hypothetical protein EYF80_010246 [Liparis tanakae]
MPSRFFPLLTAFTQQLWSPSVKCVSVPSSTNSPCGERRVDKKDEPSFQGVLVGEATDRVDVDGRFGLRLAHVERLLPHEFEHPVPPQQLLQRDITLFPVVVPCSNSIRWTPSLSATSHTPARSLDIVSRSDPAGDGQRSSYTADCRGTRMTHVTAA